MASSCHIEGAVEGRPGSGSPAAVQHLLCGPTRLDQGFETGHHRHPHLCHGDAQGCLPGRLRWPPHPRGQHRGRHLFDLGRNILRVWMCHQYPRTVPTGGQLSGLYRGHSVAR